MNSLIGFIILLLLAILLYLRLRGVPVADWALYAPVTIALVMIVAMLAGRRRG